LASRAGIIVVGLVIGVVGALLQKAGNPPNMGICVACFERDIAGALGLHRFAAAQYMRPEIIGFVLGAMLAAFLFGEFRSRGGSAPIARFLLGVFAAIGSLVFLGCSWRALFRVAGGDGNGIVGLAGMVVGVCIAGWFLNGGFTLGRSRPMPRVAGLIMPLIMILFLVLLVIRVSFKQGEAIFFSENWPNSAKWPGSLHAPLLLSLGAGLLIGFLAQRTRFCTIGAFRDVVLIRDFDLISGVTALVFGALVANLFLGQFRAGFAAMPISHSNHLWNFLGMLLAGLAFTLGGGCPGRQLILSGEGDGDAATFVTGMIVGAAFAHNFLLAGVPDKVAGTVGGPGYYGQIAVLMGLAFCTVLGLTAREKA